MSVQLPPNSTGSVVATLTSGSKEYQENILSDGVTPTNLASVLVPGAAESLEIASLRVGAHPLDGNKTTFRACTVGRSPGTSATTCIANLIGSSTKIIRLTRLEVSFNEATAAAIYTLNLVKTSTAASGGTASTETVTPLDANDTATGVAKFFTVAPTVGTATGIIATRRIFGSITGTAAATDVVSWEFGNRAKCPRLAAVVTDTFELKIYASTAVATPANAGQWNIMWEWTEE